MFFKSKSNIAITCCAIIALAWSSNAGARDYDFIAQTAEEDGQLLIEDGDLGYQEIGAWHMSKRGGFDGSITRYSSDPHAEAVWTGDLDPGVYQLSVYTVADPLNTRQARFTYTHNDGEKTKLVDLRRAESGWMTIGDVIVGQNRHFRLRLTNGMKIGALRADAVHLLPVSVTGERSVIVLDTTSDEYRENGNWRTIAANKLAEAPVRATKNGGSAGWKVRVPKGRYQIFLYGHTGSASTSTALLSVQADQGFTSKSMLDLRQGSSGWKRVGTYDANYALTVNINKPFSANDRSQLPISAIKVVRIGN